MNPTTGQLLQSGLVITALGMGLVFASLAVLWALLTLLTRLLPDRGKQATETSPSVSNAEPDSAPMTNERARVAAVAAGAFLSSALSMGTDAAPVRPFEHGRISPAWVTGSRGRPARPA